MIFLNVMGKIELKLEPELINNNVDHELFHFQNIRGNE